MIGSQADPNTDLANAALSPMFLAWVAVGLILVALALTPLGRQTPPSAQYQGGIR